MAMVVKNNMTAINTLNTLNKNSSALSKSLQKVSSGMKINSAADDASGYAISERMRVQIRSLDQANQNTQNGSSMMKVAEGAVSSTVEILKTLKEKAVNAANDSNTDSDRQTIQKELDQSIDQINDNANVTFNGKYLVDGSKNTLGKATYTALSNQSLSEDTTADTKLTKLEARNGDSLEIRDTDKVTVSYVQGGKTYSTTFQVGDKNLQDIFAAAEDIDKNSQIFASSANDSVLAARKADGVITESQATGAKDAYKNAVADWKAVEAQDKVNEAKLGSLNDSASDAGKAKQAVTDWNAAASEWNNLVGEAFTGTSGTIISSTDGINTSGDYLDALAKDDKGYKVVAGLASTAAADNTISGTNGLNNAFNKATDGAVAKAEAAASATAAATDANAALDAVGTKIDATLLTNLKNLITAKSKEDGATKESVVSYVKELGAAAEKLSNAATKVNTDIVGASVKADGTAFAGSSYETFSKLRDGTTTTNVTATGHNAVKYAEAKKAYEDNTKVALLTGKTVGMAASDDNVTTASGEKAITVTANNAGIGGQISGLNISITDSQGNVKKSANAALDAFGETVRAQNDSADNAISLQVGASANQSIKVGLTDMRAEALGLQGSDGTKLNISTQTKANAAINVLDNAIAKALDQQTTIGSIESRLEYTSSNLTTASENVQSSESTIRDADMAKEMTNYTKNNVLLQAAQSMLAQANQSSSNVLSLLQ